MREEVTRTWSPLGLLPVDGFRSGPPFEPLIVRLDRLDGASWSETTLRCTRSTGGMITYPGLEHRPVVTPGMPPKRYRIRVDSQFYIPAFRAVRDGFEFLAPPFNETNPPAQIAAGVGMLSLVPGPAYPYEAGVRVLRGIVQNGNGSPVRDATVSYAPGLVEALSDEGGHFALGLLRAPQTGQIAVDVSHPRTGRAASPLFVLPQALASNQIIVLP